MADPRPLLDCPLCPGNRMERITAGAAELDHCPRCGGVWFENGEIRAVRGHGAAAVWARIRRRDTEIAVACPGCDAPLDRGDPKCYACGRKNLLDCPACARPMRRDHRFGVDVDACRWCRGVWFDHGELDALWREKATARASAVSLVPDVWIDGDVVRGTADLVSLAGEGASAAARAAAHLPDAAGAAFEAATHLLEAAGAAFEGAAGLLEMVGHAAEAVFHVVGAILGGLFDGV